MHRRTINLTGQLAGVVRCAGGADVVVQTLDADAKREIRMDPPAPREDPALRELLATLQRVVAAAKTSQQLTAGEIAASAVELGIAVAEHLVKTTIDADSHRLDRIVRGVLERFSNSRQVRVRAHPQDIELLKRQFASSAEFQGGADLLSFDSDARMPRGELKLESEEWFAEWNIAQGLADLRNLLLEESLAEES